MQTESAVIEAVKKGDIEQFAWLVEQHSAKIFALAKSIINNQEDAEEITQDVFVKAFKSLDKFRGDAKFSSFLYRICYNESMNFLRKRKVDFTLNEEINTESIKIDGFFEVKYKEQKYFLNLALEQMHPDYRMILTLFYLKEQSYNEIVDATGMSLSNVKVKLHRAKQAFEKAMNSVLNHEAKSLI